MRACTSSSSRTRTSARTSWPSRTAAAGSRTTRWTGTARRAASTPKAARAQTANTPGRTPRSSASHLFDERGVDVAILHPMTRGIMPDRHLGTAIAAGHNEMMVTRWLDDGAYRDRFRGTIRINPDDVTGSLREIAKYKDHPKVVQIGVPLQSREVYGKPQYWPLWEAAVDANLPVAVHIEVGAGLSFAPTPSGVTRTYEQYVSFMALNYLYHLMNMIAEGVFETNARAEVRLGRRRGRHADSVHLADGLLRTPTPRTDAVGAEDAERLPARPRLLHPGRDGRPRRRRVRRRMVRLHRQRGHGDVRLQLPALAGQRAEGAQPPSRPNSATSCAGATPRSSTG